MWSCCRPEELATDRAETVLPSGGVEKDCRRRVSPAAGLLASSDGLGLRIAGSIFRLCMRNFSILCERLYPAIKQDSSPISRLAAE